MFGGPRQFANSAEIHYINIILIFMIKTPNNIERGFILKVSLHDGMILQMTRAPLTTAKRQGALVLDWIQNLQDQINPFVHFPPVL